jgi:hypothetical protein
MVCGESNLHYGGINRAVVLLLLLLLLLTEDGKKKCLHASHEQIDILPQQVVEEKDHFLKSKYKNYCCKKCWIILRKQIGNGTDPCQHWTPGTTENPERTILTVNYIPAT